MRKPRNRHPWHSGRFGAFHRDDKAQREQARRVLRGQCRYCVQNALQEGQECPLCGWYEESK